MGFNGFKARILLAASIAIVAVSVGAAAAMARPSDLVGQRLYLSDSNYLEIDEVRGNVVYTVNAAHRSNVWLADCLSPVRGATLDFAAFDRLYPLAVGKSVTADLTREHRHWVDTVTVEGEETISLPIGTYRTLRIVDHEVATSHVFESIITCWYAPELGYTVQREKRVLRGTGPKRRKWQVVRIDRSRQRSEPLTFHAPPPGMSFVTSAGAYVVRDVRNGVVEVDLSQSERRVLFVGGLIALNKGYWDAETERKAERLWPLAVGNEVSLQANWDAATAYFSGKVLEKSRLEVPAGSFDTYKVEWKIDGTRLSHVYWYAPALDFPVKKDIIDTGVRIGGWELRSVRGADTVADAPTTAKTGD